MTFALRGEGNPSNEKVCEKGEERYHVNLNIYFFKIERLVEKLPYNKYQIISQKMKAGCLNLLYNLLSRNLVDTKYLISLAFRETFFVALISACYSMWL